MESTIFKYYPKIEDDDFYKKIFTKKEFNKTYIEKKKETNEEFLARVCSPSSFRPLPQQDFLRNYISIDTPYNGILVYHGTGAGKTCAAILIAEGFKKMMKNFHKRILILAGQRLSENFINTLYNIEKESNKKKKDDIVQCTGSEYSLKESETYLTKDQQLRQIRKNISSNYKFMGYLKFANYIKAKTNWNGKKATLTDNIKDIINLEFSNRIIIIDEVHNIKSSSESKKTSKTVPPILEAVIKYSKNKRIILMSATPMYDRPNEIIYLLNLLLLNDDKPEIKSIDIFNSDGYLTKQGEHILEKNAKGYISYFRGNNPISFPIRIYPREVIIPKYKYEQNGQKIEKINRIKYTKIYPCYMSKFQYMVYKNSMKKYINNSNNNKLPRGIMDDVVQISNIVFPKRNDFVTHGSKAFTKSNDGNGSFYKILQKIPGSNKKLTVFKYQSHVLFNKGTRNEKPFFDINHIEKYSIKFYTILKNIITAKGPIFVYSRFNWAGVIPFAIMLEQNGFERYTVEGETQLLNYSYNKSGGGGKSEPISCINGLPITHKKNRKKPFKVAKYLLVTGDTDICKINITHATNLINSPSNMRGEDIKVIIGTKVIGEGIDLKNIRQVHIIEPWYNFSSNEQIIGRAIRNCSHMYLPPDERNVEIYQYASLPNKSATKIEINTETIDEKNIRIAENKDKKIKEIEYLLKRVSVDCNLFRNANIFNDDVKVSIITSTGRKVTVSLKDKPYSRECDYKKECNYNCMWKINKNYKIDKDTYNIQYAKTDIQDAKYIIKNLYKLDWVYKLDDIINRVKKKIPYIENMFIYIALDELLNNENENIEDRYNRSGRIIFRGLYYIYQPNNILYKQIPMYYRKKPLTVKPKYIEIATLLPKILPNTKKEDKKDDNIYKNIDEKFIKNVNKRMDIWNNYIKTSDKKLLEVCIEYYFSRMDSVNVIYFLKKIVQCYITISKNNIIGLFIKLNKNIFIKDKKEITGFIYNNNLYNFNKKSSIWKQSTNSDIINKDTYKDITKSIIFGELIKNKSNNKVLKIVDTSKDKNTITLTQKKSLRSVITGRACVTHRIIQLIDICKKLGYILTKSEKKKKHLCIIIELILRLNTLNLLNNKTWFIDNT